MANRRTLAPLSAALALLLLSSSLSADARRPVCGRPHRPACPIASPSLAPSPSATPRPTPSPTPSPAPSATPGRPFDAPVTNSTRTVPGSIDASGSTDVQAALNAFVAASPDGSLIAFPAGATYRLSKGILLAGRNNIVLDGNGASLRMTISGSDEAASAFLLRGSNHVAIEDFSVSTTEASWPANSGENAHALGLSGWYGGQPSSYVEITRVSASHLHGDFAYLEGQNVLPRAPSHHVWVHDNSADYTNRNAVSLINVTDAWIEGNDFDHISYHVFDLEPNFPEERIRRIEIRGNTVGSYAHRTNLLGFFVADVAFSSGAGAIASSITIADNTVAGIAASGYDGTPRALDSKFISTGSTRHSDIALIGNSTSRTVDATWGSGGVFYFARVDGIELAGNIQPITSGSTLARFDDCTGVVGP